MCVCVCHTHSVCACGRPVLFPIEKNNGSAHREIENCRNEQIQAKSLKKTPPKPGDFMSNASSTAPNSQTFAMSVRNYNFDPTIWPAAGVCAGSRAKRTRNIVNMDMPCVTGPARASRIYIVICLYNFQTKGISRYENFL